MIDDIFNNQFYKLCIGFILALVLTFSHEIQVIKEYWILLIVISITLLLINDSLSNDFGIILLLSALLIITYNQNVNKKSRSS
jgi:membrane-bound ClpP family serine protease